MDGEALTRNAAIALAGAHPMMLTGGETPNAAERVAMAMTEALPQLMRGQLEKIQQSGLDPWIRRGRSPSTPPCVVARPGDPMMRGENSPVGLTQMAHLGVLAAGDVHRWTLEPLVELYAAATRGGTRDQKSGITLNCLCRVTGDWTGCGCPSHARKCGCGEKTRKKADRELWTGPARWLFDIECAGIDLDATIDADTLRNMARTARLFRLRTRDQPKPNGRTLAQPKKRGWQRTKDATGLCRKIRKHKDDEQRLLQVARTIADIDEKGRLTIDHVGEAAELTAHLRRYPHNEWTTGTTGDTTAAAAAAAAAAATTATSNDTVAYT